MYISTQSHDSFTASKYCCITKTYLKTANKFFAGDQQQSRQQQIYRMTWKLINAVSINAQLSVNQINLHYSHHICMYSTTLICHIVILLTTASASEVKTLQRCRNTTYLHISGRAGTVIIIICVRLQYNLWMWWPMSTKLGRHGQGATTRSD